MMIITTMMIMIAGLIPTTIDAFVVAPTPSSSVAFLTRPTITRSSTTTTTTALHMAIGVLAKKAKQASLRQYVEAGVPEPVLALYQTMQTKMKDMDLQPQSSSSAGTMGPLQQELTRRKGTITVIAEYKRKNSFLAATGGGMIKDIYDIEIVSPMFREFLASGIAVMADERMGGCNYDDLQQFCLEQARARNEVPGPVRIINNDLIIDPLQVARTKHCGAHAVVLPLSLLDPETELVPLLKAAKALELESIVAVSTAEEAQCAIDYGARMISVVNVESIEDKAAVIANLNVPAGPTVTTIANLGVQHDNSLQEIEAAWAVRDKGFNCVWVGETLYKSGSLDIEHPGAIIKSMKSKSSLKWASPRASSGKGEGAREYLGDIMM